MISSNMKRKNHPTEDNSNFMLQNVFPQQLGRQNCWIPSADWWIFIHIWSSFCDYWPTSGLSSENNQLKVKLRAYKIFEPIRNWVDIIHSNQSGLILVLSVNQSWCPLSGSTTSGKYDITHSNRYWFCQSVNQVRWKTILPILVSSSQLIWAGSHSRQQKRSILKITLNEWF